MRKLLEHPLVQKAAAWVAPRRKEVGVSVAMLLVLIGPFLLKPADSTSPRHFDRRLVIMTPHPGLIRDAFGPAFAAKWREKTGQVLYIDWRVPGGTSEIAALLKSEYTAAFQQHWQRDLGREWSPDIAQSFLSDKSDSEARRAFLASNTGIGVDVFFGGGSYDFESQARAGTLVAGDGEKTGLTSLMKKNPAWFTDAAIPENVSGEPFRDPKGRWSGACISSSGIVYNKDVLQRLGIKKEPTAWSDLADPRYFGQIALTDPAKSGSVAKVFEMLLQQEMQAAMANAAYTKLSAEGKLAQGWTNGLALIQRIAANARYFSDTSTKIPLDVLRGEAAAGMCIDFYGRRAQEDAGKREDGTCRIGFIAPQGGTSVSVDPIGMFRGAADAELATAFIEFVLSDEGQRLWCYRAGEPGGPGAEALRRLSVRRDFYTPENLKHMSDADEMPFEKAKSFTYRPELTAAAFSSIRFLVRVLCVDPHEELKAAWQAIHSHSKPAERALIVMQDLSRVPYDSATGSIRSTLSSRDKIQEARLARQLSDTFRNQYEKALQMALRGE